MKVANNTGYRGDIDNRKKYLRAIRIMSQIRIKIIDNNINGIILQLVMLRKNRDKAINDDDVLNYEFLLDCFSS